MKFLRIDELQPGAIAAKDVRDVSGRMLVPAGAALSEKHLRAFKIWGVEKVAVETASGSDDVDAPLSPRDADPEALARAQAEAAERFRCVPADHPVVAVLRDLCVSRLLARAASLPTAEGNA